MQIEPASIRVACMSWLIVVTFFVIGPSPTPVLAGDAPPVAGEEPQEQPVPAYTIRRAVDKIVIDGDASG